MQVVKKKEGGWGWGGGDYHFVVHLCAFSVKERFCLFLVAAQLERCLNTIHEEHFQKMRTVQHEAMKLCQQISDLKEAEEKAKEVVHRLNPALALEITAAPKVQKFMILL